MAFEREGERENAERNNEKAGGGRAGSAIHGCAAAAERRRMAWASRTEALMQAMAAIAQGLEAQRLRRARPSR